MIIILPLLLAHRFALIIKLIFSKFARTIFLRYLVATPFLIATKKKHHEEKFRK